MKISAPIYYLAVILSFTLLTGFTCSKHAPEKAPEVTSEENKESGSVPQEQMTEQTTSGDATSVTN